MTAEEWRDVDRVVADALELSPADRDAFLQARLQGRGDLIREAGSLLAYAEVDDPDPLIAPPLGPTPGLQVAAYRLLERAGEGGMGVVWAAERADGQFQRRVAVKFLSALFPTRASVDRFLLERDILARLDHPHIARLLDGGMLDEIHPYLVMEWVDGARIDDYCRQLRLPTPEILRLFQQVANVVAYAHQRLVMHRDLKPSNLLVTPEGEVKLLDFGIAKMSDPSTAGDATAVLSRALTPEYASPEHLRGEPVTTSTDVYSLGVVLYELLTNVRPVQFEGKTLAEVLNDAGRVAPARPSSVRPGLAPELDAIVLKAMRANPAERYASASDMSADIDNFLAGRPVKARSNGAFYVARKFIRRHWVPVSVGVIAVALIAGSAVVATRQRIRAEHRFEQLRQLAGAVIFEFQDNISLLPGTLEVRRQMVKRSLEYLDSLAADSRDDPRLLAEIGWGYQRMAQVQGKPSQASLGDFRGALSSARKARATFERLLELQPGDISAASDLGDLIFLTGNIQSRVENEDYQATYREGVVFWENLAKRYPDDERAVRGLASAMFYKRDYERALVLYEQLSARPGSGTRYQRDIALMCRTLANKTAPDRQRKLVDRAIDIDRRRVEQRPLDREARLDLSFDLSMLATWHENTGDPRGAVPVFQEVLATREELVRQDPRDEQAKDRLLYALCALGQLHGQLHEYPESVRYYRRALDLAAELSKLNSRPNAQFAGLVAQAKEGLARASRSR